MTVRIGVDGPVTTVVLDRPGKPVIAAIDGYAVAGGLERPSGATCASPRATRSWASSAGG